MIIKADRLNTVEEYYFSTKLKEVNSLIKKGKPIINLGIGSPDLTPPQDALEALKVSLTHQSANNYQNYNGLEDLRVSISKFYNKHYNVDLDFNSEILPLMGSKEGIMHISLAFLNVGDSVLIPNPGYPTYASVTNLVQAKAICYDLVPENNWLPNFEELEKNDLKNVKLMWVNYPHMPTGATCDVDFFEQLISFAKKHQILLVNDNPYSFILNNKPISIFNVEGSKDYCLELNSLSKTFNMSGWRVGMVSGNKENISNILKVKSNMDSGMYYPIQRAAIAVLNSTNSWFDKMNEIYDERRVLVKKLADSLNCKYENKSSGMFVWAKINSNKKSKEFTDDLLYKHNIFIAPGDIFGSNGEGYVRFSLCATKELITKAIKRINE
ncbi:MAG: pyridoxal phosphate-dependent aminotransferase [Flavobacteriales bacterium]|jgi:LL-diaminopimelate aminotransferase|tara:strand:- start:7422 stop:8570 length:1149 start_codon:yes stop_codon:yes gene_type:complete